ncbi:MAG: PAS domain S-box protein [Nibricoccus sp.]
MTDISSGEAFSALPSSAMILDRTGIVLSIDTEWRLCAPTADTVSESIDIGSDYLAICRSSALAGADGAAEVLAGLESVLSGKRPVFVFDCPARAPSETRWFQMVVLALSGDVFRVAVIYLDITEQKRLLAGKEESLNGFHEVIRTSNLAYVVIDAMGGVLDLNESYLHLAGRTDRNGIIGRHVSDLVSKGDHQRLMDAIIRCISTGGVRRIELDYCRDSKNMRVVGMNLVRITAETTPRVVAFCFDLTEQKREAMALRNRTEKEDRYRAVVETQTELVCRYLPDTTLTFVNEAYCRFFQMTREELVGRTFLDFIPVGAREDALSSIGRTISGKQPVIYEHEVTGPDGEAHWQEWVDIPIYDNAGRIIELQGIGRDITQQHQAEEQLKLSHRHVHDLASRLMRAQEIERRSIARELHDDLSQRLAAHAIALSNLKRRMPELPEAMAQRMSALESEAMSLGDSVRQLSHQLHPAVLEQLGMPAALRSFCTEAAERSGLIFHVDAKDPKHIMTDQVALALYRVAQETIRNIERHARAKNVWVSVFVDERNAKMEIRDDGVGFDASGSKKSTGLGLISVEERIRFLNGRLALESRPGNGTSIHVYIPQPQATL